MTNREKQILSRVVNILRERLDPYRVILFGSRAKGMASKNADFDFAVDRKNVDISAQREIMEEIEKVAGLYKIDIVYMDKIKRDFKNIILKSGEVLYEKGS